MHRILTRLRPVQQHYQQPVRNIVLNLDTMNPYVKNIEYAVRGPIVTRAAAIEKELKSGNSSNRPFTEVVKCNIGDCHAVGQQPITFLRQVVALMVDPSLMASPNYPSDAKERARTILADCGGASVGAYSHACGVQAVRNSIADYIQQRDAIPANADDIFLSTGASEAVKAIMELLCNCKSGNDRAGIMIPIPQYPLYTATISQYNLHSIPYYLDEADNWSLSLEELERAYNEQKSNCEPRALVVINPGNPTGQVLRREIVESVIRFAKEKNLFLLADEVYQQNVYATGAQFHSFKSVLHSMGDGLSDGVEIASFMSASKGYMGECGFRGGYCELLNLDEEVKAMLYKQLSARLCPSVIGQGIMAAIANPPKPGEPSYQQFQQEKDSVLNDLAVKAKLATETFNSMTGISCNVVQGAMYAFPSLTLPQGLIDAATAEGMQPDAFYCTQLLEHTGICVVPGSGFGQRQGTHHLRMTILPPVAQLQKVMQSFKNFHEDFIARYQ